MKYPMTMNWHYENPMISTWLHDLREDAPAETRAAARTGLINSGAAGAHRILSRLVPTEFNYSLRSETFPDDVGFDILKAIGAPAAPAMISWLPFRASSQSRGFYEALRAIQPSLFTVAGILRTLHDPDPEVRGGAADILLFDCATFGITPESATAAIECLTVSLVNDLQHPALDVRNNAASQLVTLLRVKRSPWRDSDSRESNERWSQKVPLGFYFGQTDLGWVLPLIAEKATEARGHAISALVRICSWSAVENSSGIELDPIAPIVEAGLRDPELRIRLAALRFYRSRANRFLGYGKPVERLAVAVHDALGDKNACVRASATRVMGCFSETEYRQKALEKSLKDRNWRVRWTAFVALKSETRIWARGLDDQRKIVRDSVYQYLERDCSSHGLLNLIAAANESDSVVAFVANHAERILGFWNGQGSRYEPSREVISTWKSSLTAEHIMLRLYAALHLAGLGETGCADLALPILAEALHHPGVIAHYHSHAMEAMIALKEGRRYLPMFDEIVSTLKSSLTSEHIGVRLSAALALATFGETGRAAVPILAEALHHPGVSADNQSHAKKAMIALQARISNERSRIGQASRNENPNSMDS